MLKRKFLIKVMAAAIAATMVIAPATALAEGGETVDALDQDVTMDFGDLTENEEHQSAVSVASGSEHTASVTTGNLTSDAGPGASASAVEGSEINLDVNGNIDSNGYGVETSAYDGSTTTVVVNGDVTSADSGGVDAEAGSYETSAEETDNSAVNVIVNGDVSAHAEGVYTSAELNCTSNVTVNGDVESEWTGVISYADGGTAACNVDITGNVKGGEYSGIIAGAYGDGTNNIKTGGDVSAEGTGVYMRAFGLDYGKPVNNIVIEGTLSAKEAAVVSTGDGENTLTVWKIETPGYTAAKYEFNETTGRITLVEDEEAAQQIQYIIKVKQTDGASLRATDANGNALATVTGVNGNALEYAYEGDKVLLKVDVSDDYWLDAAYGDDGQKLKLVKDASGNYYINVPRNGGVSFSVKLTYVGHDKDDDDDDKDKDKNKNTVYTALDASVAAAVSAVSSTPAGGSAAINIAGDKLDASLVSTLLSRSDVTVVLTCIVNGRLVTITIPAGSDIASFVSTDGSISISALAEKFGSKPV